MKRQNLSATNLTKFLKASPERVYRALTTAEEIAIWKVPDGMSCEIHQFDSRERGQFRVSLTYEDPHYEGKSSKHTDTYHGYFKTLRPNQEVVEVIEFESEDPGMRGEMLSTMQLEPKDGGTLLTVSHENLPPALKESENNEGWRLSLEKLACLVERR